MSFRRMGRDEQGYEENYSLEQVCVWDCVSEKIFSNMLIDRSLRKDFSSPHPHAWPFAHRNDILFS